MDKEEEVEVVGEEEVEVEEEVPGHQEVLSHLVEDLHHLVEAPGHQEDLSHLVEVPSLHQEASNLLVLVRLILDLHHLDLNQLVKFQGPPILVVFSHLVATQDFLTLVALSLLMATQDLILVSLDPPTIALGLLILTIPSLLVAVQDFLALHLTAPDHLTTKKVGKMCFFFR